MALGSDAEPIPDRFRDRGWTVVEGFRSHVELAT
ncbi:hypothetical protein BJ970_001157 [Saccharopolyspora phatthalungensis]|uniref:Uncharacterized protein n=1 Tax=Saccharopolyspora phatthalungensis TaxID=664693 RepID=A0A840Q9Y3_9PSEU|nr:hypothetical protein [Saccharopolyspora phatthalungensis]